MELQDHAATAATIIIALIGRDALRLPLGRFRSPWLACGFGSVPRSVPLGLRFGRPGPLLSRAEQRPDRPDPPARLISNRIDCSQAALRLGDDVLRGLVAEPALADGQSVDP